MPVAGSYGRVRRDAFRAESGGVNQRVWMLVNKGEVFLELLDGASDHLIGLLGFKVWRATGARIIRPRSSSREGRTSHDLEQALPLGTGSQSR